ncbi:histidine kinase, partial [Achromobacter ruhlandii]|nr:histidine kinase [Achromobacter ruhlandii]
MFARIGAGGGALWLCCDPQALWTGGARYQTAVGEQRQVTLSDGSALALNTGTNLYVQFTRQERRILLREGEIQVTTAPDPEGRGFKVVTRNGELVPLGTRFIVRDHADNGRQSLVAVQHGWPLYNSDAAHEGLGLEPGGRRLSTTKHTDRHGTLP